MAISTYTELVTAIGNWLERDDLTDRIPEFIRLTEARMQRVLRDYSTRVSNYTVALDADTGVTTTVPGLQGVVDVTFVGLRVVDAALDFSPPEPLEQVAERELMRLHAECPETAKPTKYAILGQTIGVYPFPDVPEDSTGADSSYVLVLSMVGPTTTFAVPITASNYASNPLLAAHPDLYLYGALAESAPYLQHDERIPVWEGRFQQIVKEIAIQHDRLAHFSGGGKRTVLPVVFG